jgi:glycine cleavage system aminomethyltransferase T
MDALFSPAIAAQDRSNAAGRFGLFGPMLLCLEYTSWVEENQAHVQSCYLGDWTPLNKIGIQGPEALAFLSRIGVARLAAFEVGQIKHHVQLDEQGRIASEGVLYRLGPDEFRYTAGSGDWLRWQFGLGNWDAVVSDISPDHFIFGIQGPTSLFVLEKLAGQRLRDIGFSRARPTTLAGFPVWILRTGISGELGYEIHGPAGAGAEIWAAVLDAGAEFGLRQLGFRAQPVQHIEAGIATNGLDYLPASIVTPGAPTQFRRRPFGGSFSSTDLTDYFRTPGELGWGPRKAVPDHDFLGRDALAAELAAGGPARALVGLLWNADDVAQVLTSMAGTGELIDQMEIPRSDGPSFDLVHDGGQAVGISSGRCLSANLRATISLCVLDRAAGQTGRDVVVVWGRPGTPQREIRAQVVALPFKPDRRRTDVTALPGSVIPKP